MPELISIAGARHAHAVIRAARVPDKARWLFSFLASLPASEATPERLDELYQLYRTSEPREIPPSLDHLPPWRDVEPDLVVRVMEILVIRAESSPDLAHHIGHSLSRYSEVGKNVKSIFEDAVPILIAAYHAADQPNGHVDHDAWVFNAILDLDPKFAEEYLEIRHERRDHRRLSSSHRDYERLWLREDIAEIMAGVIQKAYDLEQRLPSWYDSSLDSFFAIRSELAADQQNRVQSVQDELLRDMIRLRAAEPEFMRFLFELIRDFAPTRRIPLIAELLTHNKDFEVFASIGLEPASWGAHGSLVPVYQERAEFLESLLPLLRGRDFLRHHTLIEQRVESYRSQIEHEKKRDFLEAD